MDVMKSWCVTSMAVIIVMAAAAVLTAAAQAQTADDEPGDSQSVEKVSAGGSGLTKETAMVFAVAITVGVGCLSAGYAVGKVGAAALGAASERPEIMGRALIFVGLAEGIAIYGLIVGIMLIVKL